MKRCVVTGGAGFIGSALVRRLIGKGDTEVLVFDNLLTGRLKNLDKVSGRITLEQSDIRDYAALALAVRGADVVFHLAAIPSVPRSIDDPVLCHEINIDGTFNVFRACAAAKVPRVVYAASCSAYGDTDLLPNVETMAPRPKSPYAVQKLTGEYYANVFHSCFGVETVALRFFNVYGERQDPSSPYSGVLSLFLKALIGRRPPTIFGDGNQTRDFIYVEDVAALCYRAATAKGAAGRTYNTGSGTRYSLNYVWDLLQKMEGADLPPRFGPVREGDVRDSQADITAARRDLGHEPEYTIEQGLGRTLAWLRAEEQAC
jgi:nucleoside-diphosphate-sugar epimerase